MIQDLFKTPIYNTSLNIDNELLLNLSYQEKENDTTGRRKSNNGYQTKDLDFKTYKFLFDEISKHAIKYYCVYNADIKSHYFSNFWINISGKHNYNRLHSHNGSFISGVYYIKVPKNSGAIVFENPSCMFIENTFKKFDNLTFSGAEDFNSYNSPEWRIEPLVGQLIMFPSYLRHYVEENQSDDDRISLSFNIMINQ